MLKKFKIISLILAVAIIIFLIFPLPFTLFSKSQNKQFPQEPPVALISNEQNRGERCKEKTIYDAEENGYTKTGEEILNPYCAKLQSDLDKAVQVGDITLIKDLLAKGANVNSPSDNYDLRYSIVTAVNSGNPSITKLILDNGADVNFQRCCCASCETLLDIAVKHNDVETEKLLLERGADIYAEPKFTDGQKYTPLDVAAFYGNFETGQLFERACNNSLKCRAEFRAKRLWSFLNTMFAERR